MVSIDCVVEPFRPTARSDVLSQARQGKKELELVVQIRSTGILT